MKKFVALLMVMVLGMCMLTGCTESDRVSYNISKEANNFNVTRKLTVINARTDTVLLEMIGTFSLSNNSTNIGNVPNCDPMYSEALDYVIMALNEARHCYLDTKDKAYWWQMIQLLPTSYDQRRTVQLNYAVLRNIYHSRKNHKLNEWLDFCGWIKDLPYSELITDTE